MRSGGTSMIMYVIVQILLCKFACWFVSYYASIVEAHVIDYTYWGRLVYRRHIGVPSRPSRIHLVFTAAIYMEELKTIYVRNQPLGMPWYWSCSRTYQMLGHARRGAIWHYRVCCLWPLRPRVGARFMRASGSWGPIIVRASLRISTATMLSDDLRKS